MPACVNIVQGVEDNVKALKPFHGKTVIVLDVAMVRNKKPDGVIVRFVRGHIPSSLASHSALGLTNVVSPEEELTVQVGNINSIEINDLHCQE